LCENLVTKQRVDPKWFHELRTGGLKEHLEWLTPLTTCVDRLVTFGCWSSEPFALMWTLDGVEVIVVELSEGNLAKARAESDTLERLSLVGTHPAFGCMDGRSVQFIVGDMTQTPAAPSGRFDLAYCEDVLYQIYLESAALTGVQAAVNEMARVVKPGGWIIAVEPMIGAEGKAVRNDFVSQRMGRPITHCGPAGQPIDISRLFEDAGLARATLDGAPKGAYCYKKPDGARDARPGVVTR